MAINMPQQKSSPLDRIAQALQIVGSVYGIKANSQALDKAKIEQQVLEEQRNRLKNNILTPKEVAEYGKDYDISDTEAPGSIKFGLQSGDQVQNKFFTPKNKKATPLTQPERAKLIGDGFKEVTPGTRGATEFSYVGADGSVQRAFLLPPPLKSDPEKEPKPDQFKAATFAKRMEQAESVFKSLNEGGFDPTSWESEIQGFSIVPERFKSDLVKQQQQAERNFLNAALRRESGANITKDEFASGVKQYFPRGGDSADVLSQKAANRAQVIAGLKAESGNAYKRVPGVEVPLSGKKGDFNLIPEAQAGSKAPSFGADVIDYAKRFGITPEQAQNIKSMRVKQ